MTYDELFQSLAKDEMSEAGFQQALNEKLGEHIDRVMDALSEKGDGGFTAVNHAMAVYIAEKIYKHMGSMLEQRPTGEVALELTRRLFHTRMEKV